MPMAPHAWNRALRPSEIFCVTELPIRTVSDDNRLMISPVFVLSKKPTSCLMTEENNFSLMVVIIL